jgi:4-amino-4-deoxy-L-arabinose transferase-like glycosyltransferase
MRPLRTALDRRLLLILGVALVLRLAWGLWAATSSPTGPFTGGDNYSYWYYGRAFAAGEGYISYTSGVVTSYYPIGYPSLLAGTFWLVDRLPIPGGDADVVAVLHAVLGTATVWFTYVIGRSVGGRRLGLVAAGLVALWPNLVLYTPTFALEPAFMAASTGALAVAASHDWDVGPPSLRRSAAFGLALAISVAIRPFSLPFLVAFAVAIVATRAGWRTALRCTGVAALVVLVSLVPWTIRNAVALDALVPVSTNLGDTACMARFPGSDGGFSFTDHEWCADPALPEAERNQRNLRMAIRFVREHPAEEARLVVRRFRGMMAHDHSGLDENEAIRGRDRFLGGARRAVTTLADAWFAVVMVGAAVGLVLLMRGWRRHPVRALVVISTLTFLAIPLLLWGNTRFHVPLAPLAAVAAARLVVRPGTP